METLFFILYRLPLKYCCSPLKMYKYQGNASVFYGKEQDNVSSLCGFTGQASQHRKRTFLSEKSVMQTSTRSCRCSCSCSLSWMRQTWLSDDALLYSDILIYHSLRGGSHPWIHTLPHTHIWAVTVPLPLFLVPAHTHTHAHLQVEVEPKVKNHVV